MSEVFITDGENALAYERLLERVNDAAEYRPSFLAPSLAEHAANFITALAHGADISILDADLSADELKTLGVEDSNAGAPLRQKSFKNIEALLEATLLSKSKISIFTSGTTGLPKKVTHTMATLARFVRRAPDYSKNIWGFAYNPAHMAGMQVLLQAFLNQNAAVNIFKKPRDFIFEAIDKHGVTHISATPTFYRLLLPPTRICESVARLTFGGEKSSKALYEQILKIFPNAKINNIYASTEIGSLFVSSGDVFSVPQTLLGLVKIENGELFVHKSLLGESATLKFEGDFYNTGDLVEWTDQGAAQFRFVTRKSNMINVGGYKVNPEEVEDAVKTLPQVADCAVYGRANSVLGNILCADVKLNAPIEESLIRKSLEEKLQPFKIPRRIKFVEELQTTRSGKIKRQ